MMRRRKEKQPFKLKFGSIETETVKTLELGVSESPDLCFLADPRIQLQERSFTPKNEILTNPLPLSLSRLNVVLPSCLLFFFCSFPPNSLSLSLSLVV